MKKGKFIVFEGMDGSGKSTAVQLMHDRLMELDIPTIWVRIPGGTYAGENIRKILLDGASDLEITTEFMLMQATRIETYNKIIKPSIERGVWVICDRFNTSSLVYQSKVKGLSYNFVNQLIEETTPSSIIDLHVYILRPFDDVLKYLDTKNKDHFEAMGCDKLQIAYNEYDYLSSSVIEPWITLDNDGSLNDLEEKINKTATMLIKA
jgi:dTMP kinase